jgi:hypothetical protein
MKINNKPKKTSILTCYLFECAYAKATESYSVAFVIKQYYCLIFCCGEVGILLELNNMYCLSA